MQKKRAQYHCTVEILIHTISWILVFAFPLLLVDYANEIFSWSHYLRYSVVPLFFVTIFYLNYFWLVPHFLFKERTYQYILLNVFLFAILGFSACYLHRVFISMDIPLSFENRPRRPRWSFIIRDILGMCFSVGLSAILRISRRWNMLETARREAEKQRTEAELRNLRNQLNPHFLLNTLNNIYALIAFNSEKAQQAVQDLSKLLRHMLYDNQQVFVSLGKEIEFK